MAKFPKPLKKAPEEGTIVFFPELYEPEMYSEGEWEASAWFLMYLERGLVYDNKEAAIAHAEALIKFSQKKGKKNAPKN